MLQKEKGKTGPAMKNPEKELELLREFLRIDSSNPPGDEEGAALFLERILQKAGLKTEIRFAAPKRANLLARIAGKRSGRPLVLLSHIDVVPAKPAEWDADPFGGEIKEGFLYGRGAIDMKSQALFQLLAFIRLWKEGVTPENDILFLATADEEVGGTHGVEYLFETLPDLCNASFVLSEGGFIVEEDGLLHAQVSVAEKKLAQFVIRATGTGGHGSVPHKDSANEKVIDAAKAILSHPWPFKPTKVAGSYLDSVLGGRKVGGQTYHNIKDALDHAGFRRFIEENPVYNALLRNTVTPTVLKGGEKVNVIPAESSIWFDARLLPDESHQAFFKTIKRLAGNKVEVLPISSDMSNPPSSGRKMSFFRKLKAAIELLEGPIPVLPFVTTGATDLRYFRNLGIPAFGFSPIRLSKEELLRMHGKNERISLENVTRGIEGTYEIVKFLAI
jgi:acetylornithine deacetylase/succinyl-diaminopimelate desuccinylase-like protein